MKSYENSWYLYDEQSQMFTNELGYPRQKLRGSLSQTQLARKPITYLPRLNTGYKKKVIWSGLYQFEVILKQPK